MTTLRLRGEVDLTTRDAFEHELADAANTESDLILDATHLRFIDGAGLRALARTAAHLHHHGHHLRVHQPSPHLRRLLTLLDLQHLTA